MADKPEMTLTGNQGEAKREATVVEGDLCRDRWVQWLKARTERGMAGTWWLEGFTLSPDTR